MLKKYALHLPLAMALTLLLAGMACAADVKVDMNVSPEAKVLSFKCELGEKAKMADKPVTIYTFTVKNVSEEAKLFQGFIMIPETGQSAGGFIPRKGSPPQLKPGEEVTLEWAVRMFELPKEEVKLIVETVK